MTFERIFISIYFPYLIISECFTIMILLSICHLTAGMKALFTVNECASSVPLTLNKVKVNTSVAEWEYFIAVEEVVWDYGPTGTDQLTGLRLTQPGR